jgi:ribosomal-protein-alanine N-acetyltransferase
MPEPVSFRRMASEDVETVMTIERGAYEFGWTAGIFEDCLRIGYECWLLIDANTIAAYGIMSFAPGEAHVLNVCVDRNRQRKGHGRAVMEHLIALACNQGAERMWLEVRPSNESARGLYRALEFGQITRRRAYYPAARGREDALVLSRRLAEPPM